MDGPIYALSVKEPYAYLICFGCPVMEEIPVPDNPVAFTLEWRGKVIRKDVENRNWPLPKRFTIPQRVYIHAAQKFDNKALELLIKLGLPPMQILMMYGKSSPRGAIIGEVTITGCVTNSKSLWAIPGQRHFTLADPELYDHAIPYRGQQRFFRPNLAKAAA